MGPSFCCSVTVYFAFSRSVSFDRSFFVFTVVRSATRLSSGLCNAVVIVFVSVRFFRRFPSTLPLSRKRREQLYPSPSFPDARCRSFPSLSRPPLGRCFAQTLISLLGAHSWGSAETAFLFGAVAMLSEIFLVLFPVTT